jgi:MFS family permease
MPSLPHTPSMSAQPSFDARRAASCVTVSLLLGLTQGLAVNLVSANLSAIQGSFGATAVEASWLVTAFTATNVSSALLLTKVRLQFGLHVFANLGLGVFLVLSIFHMFNDQLYSAVLLRAALGFAAAPLTSLALLYMMEAWPLSMRSSAVVLGFGTLQLGAPLARVVSEDLLQIGRWGGLQMLEVALALCCVAALSMVRLRPVPLQPNFSRGDLLSFTLFSVALALFCIVLGQGRLLWWTDTPWLGVCLAAGTFCFGLYVLIELNRNRPMLDLRWIASPFMLRFLTAILLYRIALNEQAVGAIGLLTAFGLLNDQMHTLFLWVTFGTILGFGLSLIPLSRKKLEWPGYIALLLVIIAAWNDAGATVQTRAHDLIATQTMLALAASMFLASALAIGFAHVVAGGMKHFISFVAVLSSSQVLGALIGNTALSSFVTVRQKMHFAHLAESVAAFDAQVPARIAQYAAPYGGLLNDAQLRAAQGAAALSQALQQQATVQAYSDVFELIAALAAGTLLWLLVLNALRRCTGQPLIAASRPMAS